MCDRNNKHGREEFLNTTFSLGEVNKLDFASRHLFAGENVFLSVEGRDGAWEVWRATVQTIKREFVLDSLVLRACGVIHHTNYGGLPFEATYHFNSGKKSTLKFVVDQE